MKCDDCVFADWVRTSNGRLHPSKQGRCTFKKDVPIPKSMAHPAGYFNQLKVIEVRGGWIGRGDEFDKCAYFARGD